MDYEFTELEHIVSVLINPAYLRLDKPVKENLELTAFMVKNEVNAIKKRFTLAVLKAKDDTRIKIYIHRHQALLIGFADTIYSYLISDELHQPERTSRASTIIDFYEIIYGHIRHLLDYLEKNFKPYFDADARLSKICYQNFTREISNKLRLLKKGLKKQAVDERLTNIIIEPFDKLDLDGISITFRMREYLQLYLSEMLDQLQLRADNINTKQLCTLLLGLNYNNTRFFNFYIVQFETFNSELADATELIGYYLLQLKLLNQMNIRSTLAYNDHLPCITQQITHWISEELIFIEKKQRLVDGGQWVGQVSLPVNSKIHTSLAVSQLSLGIKLLIDSGIIVNNNYTELTKLVAQNFRTDRVEDISEDSLRNKYYNVEKGTADKMKAVIIELLNQVRKY